MRPTTFKALALSLTITLAAGSALPGCVEVDDTPVPPAEGGTSGATTGGTGGSAMGGSAMGGSATGGSGAGLGGAVTGGAAGSLATGGAGSAGEAGTSAGGAGNAGGGGRDTGGAAGTGGTGGRNMGGAGAGGRSTGGSAGAGGTNTTRKFVGNITTGNSVDTGGMKYSKYWDQITPENAGKWGSVQPNPSGSFNWATLDAIYAYAQTNNIIFKQHAFVWGSQQPNGTPTQAQVENWIRSFCERFPNTQLIDVVNEPPPHTTPNYTSNLGAGESGTWGWITRAFKLARQHCGGAILILNDFNNIEYTNDLNHMVDIVTQIKAANAPIDAVGCQAHATRGLSASTLQNNVNTLASRTSLPLYISEWDVPEGDDQRQLSIFQSHFPVFWNTESVKGITIWGWIVGRTWVSNSGLVNGTNPRPAMTWLMQQLDRPVPPN